MKISVIIPFYEKLAEVLTCLNSLQALATVQHEYLVQDDASPNTILSALIPPSIAHQVERNAVNLGFAGNVNAAARRATGDVLFIVNQDVYGVYNLSEGWDAALLMAFDRPAVGIVGARLLFPNGAIQNAGGLFDVKGQPFHRCLGWTNRLHREVNTGRMVSWTTGAALAIRRDVFEAVGGMDEAYRGGYFEDVDICLKARAAGFDVWYEPRCTLVHTAGTTGGNPRFMENARLFKSRWVDTGKVTPDDPAVRERWW